MRLSTTGTLPMSEAMHLVLFSQAKESGDAMASTQDLLQEVMTLQADWSNKNTTEMQRRGTIVRQELPHALRSLLPTLALEVGVTDLQAEGSDGIGQKTEIPWSRIYSKEHSPNPTDGWYLVYLFSAFGDRVYLALGQGSTQNTKSTSGAISFPPRSHEELNELVLWARSVLLSQDLKRNGFVSTIQLEARRSNLGPAYEAGTVYAIEYVNGQVPADEVLTADLTFMCSMLGAIYSASEAALDIPGQAIPEVVEAEIAIAKLAGKRIGGGQGFGLNAKERKAIELRAVACATAHLEQCGYTQIKDVGANRSYDLIAKAPDGSDFIFEVKGTTTAGESILITRNEFSVHKEHYPHNGLIVVASITLTKGLNPTADSGIVRSAIPWHILDESAVPIAYAYSLEDTSLMTHGPSAAK